jgi:hypothetical protein
VNPGKETRVNGIDETQRSLLIVSYLAELGAPNLHWLYRWLEDNAIDVARLMLAPHYFKFATLEGDEATYDRFVDRITDLTSEPQVEAVDVFLHIHGNPNVLSFKGDDKATDDIGEDLYQLDLKDKLRTLYSTACYGETHIDGFLRGGFRVASGARGVNANSAAEYPLFMANWRAAKRFKSSIHAIPAVLTGLQDQLAKIKFPDTNSEKAIGGRPYTRITDLAD